MMRFRTVFLVAALGVGLCAFHANLANAHCDGLDGPVVNAAQEALATGDVNLVLIWVQASDEAEIRRAFNQTTSVRKLGTEAQALADRYFFETLVRTHRAGEGAPFTGLKPAGRDLGPAIPAADQALKSGDVTPLINLLVDRMRDGLTDRFNASVAAAKVASRDVEAGREYVERYVTFIHHVEGMYGAATRRVEGHYPDGEAGVHEGESAAHPERGLTSR